MLTRIRDSYRQLRDAWRRKNCDVLIFGPPNSGKTTIVASWCVADRYGTPDPDTTFVPLNERVQWLKRETFTYLQANGKFPYPATTAVADFRFLLEVKYRGFWNRAFFGKNKKVAFEIIDGPGGALLDKRSASAAQTTGAGETPAAKQLLDRISRADAVVLCVDSTDDRSTTAFFDSLVGMLHLIKSEHLRCHTLIIMLTKTERYFSAHGALALPTAQDADPWPHVLRMMTQVGLGNLLARIGEETKICATWVSAYGFLPDGRPNLSQDGKGLLATSHESDADRYVRHWSPFLPLEPLKYLTTRTKGNLWFLDLRQFKARNAST